MDQQRWQRIEDLLQAALDLDTDDRPEFLRTACGGDAELHREVTALLASAAKGLALERPAAWLAGRISHYRIEEHIGSGGMGEVYRAYDERLRRPVALKALPVEFMTDAGRLRRFEQEAVAASRLNHPNIITIFETLQTEGVHLIATEHVEGETLRAMLTDPRSGKPRTLPVETALDVAMQVAAALKAAHTAWIIHRDIKPENIMVRADGLVKVLDFGIAKLSEEPEAAGAVLGTASYMSPEQALGAPLDGRTDVFSLGVVLHEMLTGRREGREILGGQGIPKPLLRVLRKMLRTNREQRHASAGELLDDLRDVKRHLEGRSARRLVRISALTAVLALALTAIAAMLSVSESWEERVLRDGHTAAARQAVFSPDGRLIASCGEDGQVIIWDFARRERVATLRHAAYRALFAPDGRTLVTGGTDGTLVMWDAQTWRALRAVRGDDSEVIALAFSPDGDALAEVTMRGVALWDARQWTVAHQWARGGSYGAIVFTPDGRQLASSFGFLVRDPLQAATASECRSFGNAIALSRDGTRLASIDSIGHVALYDVGGRDIAGAAPLLEQRAHQDHGRSVAFSPDGSLFASAAEDIVVWDAASRRKIARFEYTSIVWSVAFSPDGRWLISSHGDGAVLIWDVIERALAASLNEHSGAVRSVAFSPDGRRLASAGEDRTVTLWDLDRGGKQAVLLGHQTRVTAVAFDRAGALASADQDGVTMLWDAPARRPRLRFDPPQPDSGYCVALSPDGRTVANSFGLFAGGRQFAQWDHQYGQTYGVAFSPDGALVATASPSGRVAVWDARTGAVLQRVVVANTHQICVAFSPDGKWLVTGEDEGAVRLWSVSPLRQVAILGRHHARVKSVAFAPDRLEVASAGDDKVVALWDVRARKLRARIGTHASPVYSIAFSSDGRRIATGEHDRSVRVYTRRRWLWGFALD